jgi:SWI/SNF-related matrix-associated actin-dependent regulator of chromatin subfamily A3
MKRAATDSGLLLLDEEASEEIDNSDADHTFLGYTDCDIVGVRYYSGSVNNDEQVLLTREPTNAYDPNAVRVDNIQHQQIGHIRREQARVLAQIVDGGMARVEGAVLRGANNKFSIPVVVAFFGRDACGDALEKVLVRNGMRYNPDRAAVLQGEPAHRAHSNLLGGGSFSSVVRPSAA